MAFYAGVRDIDEIRVIFLAVLVFAILLKLLVGLFVQERHDSLGQRSLRILNFLLFSCILALVLLFVSLGAKKLRLSWLWFSNENVFTCVGVFLLLSLYQRAGWVCVMEEAFLRRGVDGALQVTLWVDGAFRGTAIAIGLLVKPKSYFAFKITGTLFGDIHNDARACG